MSPYSFDSFFDKADFLAKGLNFSRLGKFQTGQISGTKAEGSELSIIQENQDFSMGRKQFQTDEVFKEFNIKNEKEKKLKT